MNQMEKVDAAQRNEMEAFSGRLFGNRHRLEVALTILEIAARSPEALYKESIAKALGVTNAEVQKHLSVFTDLGMLEASPGSKPKRPQSRRGRPPKVLRPKQDHFWECLRELGKRFEG